MRAFLSGPTATPAVLLLALLAACGKDQPPAQPLALTAAPLPARAAVPGPRFAKLDPATTGLQHQNLLRRENVVAYVYSGAGLAVGDYDGDGLPDVYVVSQDGPNKLFRQTAPMRFVDVTATAGGLDGGDAWGTAATFADVDGDGDLDLYVCNLESPNLLYQNQGDGTFIEKAGAFGLGQRQCLPIQMAQAATIHPGLHQQRPAAGEGAPVNPAQRVARPPVAHPGEVLALGTTGRRAGSRRGSRPGLRGRQRQAAGGRRRA